MKSDDLKTTPLHPWHVAAGARMVDFSSWHMPLHYPTGIIREHLDTRRSCGIFDISHMGRFRVAGDDAVAFLRHVLTNDAAYLVPGTSQYTILADDEGCAVDDAYLCHWRPDEYMLVVNAGNASKDWRHVQTLAKDFAVDIEDMGARTAMMAVQGPASTSAMAALFAGAVPGPKRNALSIMDWRGNEVFASRTGYTGEPMGYELIVDAAVAVEMWRALVDHGLTPVGLGARDTLRLEACLPLYGHEFGEAADGRKIPLFASPLAAFAVKFSPDRGHFIGRDALARQAGKGEGGESRPPRRHIVPVAIVGRGIARAGDEVLRGDERIGWITSGTMVPYWKNADGSEADGDYGMRAIGLALVDAAMAVGDKLDVVVRGKRLPGVVVKRHLDSRHPPRAIPVLLDSAAVRESRHKQD